jgi:hypothetical protein
MLVNYFCHKTSALLLVEKILRRRKHNQILKDRKISRHTFAQFTSLSINLPDQQNRTVVFANFYRLSNVVGSRKITGNEAMEAAQFLRGGWKKEQR